MWSTIQWMTRFTFGLRALAALLIVTLLVLLRVPLCASSACPMSGPERVACQTKGMNCCQSHGGRSANSTPPAPLPDLALAARPTISEPSVVGALPAGRLRHPFAAPAVVQSVGFFTLFAVFLI